MDILKLKGAIEALLFASEQPVKIDRLAELLSAWHDDIPEKKDIKALLEDMSSEYEGEGRGVFLAEVAGGYQLRTKEKYAPLIQILKARRPPRFGRAAMEVLAIVAYRQPITRAEVEELRGVDSGGVLRSLLEKKLAKILGRKEVAGKPIIYGTTREFLEHFGLRDLSQLPPLKEFVELEKGEDRQAIKDLGVQ